MAKISSDKLPVIVLFSKKSSTRVFFKNFCHDLYFLLEVSNTETLLEKLQQLKIFALVIDEKVTSHLFELIEHIRKKNPKEAFPLFVISSELKKSYITKMSLAGVSDFLREPLTKEPLMASLEKWEKTKEYENKIGPLSKSLPSLASGKNVLKEKKLLLPSSALAKIKETLEAKSSLSLVFVETATLKKVKEEWGDEACSECEKKLKNYLSEFLRPQDLLLDVTFGKYAFLLPSTSFSASNLLMETLKESFQEKKFQIAKGKVKISLSIAIVTLKEDQLKSEETLSSLEKMLLTGEAYLEKAKTLGQRIVSS